MDFCFVIPCKGRLAHLRESLPAALAQAPCVVVDYDCPERCGDWAGENCPKARIVRVRGQPGFNLAHARNLGAAEVEADWIVFLDADVVPAPRLIEALALLAEPGVFLRPTPLTRDIWGTVACPRIEFDCVGGYDEVISGWGGEDHDLYKRLERAGLRATRFPAAHLRAIPHSDALRTCFYAIKEPGLSHCINATYRLITLDLQMHTETPPEIAVRRAVHAEVTRVLIQSLAAGGTARIDVDMPSREMLPGWPIGRSLTYTIPPPSPSLPSPPKADAAQMARESETPPMTFIVGTGRCGSTLLRLMLDSHPQMAIPAEAHFLPPLIEAAQSGASLEALVRLAAAHRAWPSFRVDAGELLDEARRRRGAPLAALLRSFYQLYARRFGKTRIGDKTTATMQYIPLLRTIFPNARFVHLVRDGRDVAVSMMRLPSWDFRCVAAAAAHWACTVLGVRAEAADPDRYLEVRYEDLVADPEAVLRRICAFIDLPWDPRMLRYHEHASSRLEEIRDSVAPDGTPIPAAIERRAHALTLEPPTLERIGRWREALSDAEQHEFEAIAGAVLAEFGYPTIG